MLECRGSLSHSPSHLPQPCHHYSDQDKATSRAQHVTCWSPLGYAPLLCPYKHHTLVLSPHPTPHPFPHVGQRTPRHSESHEDPDDGDKYKGSKGTYPGAPTAPCTLASHPCPPPPTPYPPPPPHTHTDTPPPSHHEDPANGDSPKGSDGTYPPYFVVSLVQHTQALTLPPTLPHLLPRHTHCTLPPCFSPLFPPLGTSQAP
jgi:hypothetical protein